MADNTDDEQRDVMPVAVLDGNRIFVKHVTHTEPGRGGSLRVHLDSGRWVELSPADASAFEGVLNKLEHEGLTITFVA